MQDGNLVAPRRTHVQIVQNLASPKLTSSVIFQSLLPLGVQKHLSSHIAEMFHSSGSGNA